MALTSIIQILKVNEKRSGNKNGRDWAMQDCECALLADTGELEQVGVLQLPKDMMGEAAPKPGVYVGAFALRAGMQDRKISAVLTSAHYYPLVFYRVGLLHGLETQIWHGSSVRH